MSLSRAEQETIIRFDAESEFAEIWTAQPKVYRKLKRAGCVHLATREHAGVEEAWQFSVPLANLRWRVAGKRKMSDEQRAKAAARLANARKAAR